MNPDKIITSDMLYTTDLFGCGFGNFNYRCAGNLNKAARRTYQFQCFADFLKMSPTKILGMSGVGSVTYNAFIDFLVEYPHLMNIPGFSYNPELKNLVMSKVTAKNKNCDITETCLLIKNDIEKSDHIFDMVSGPRQFPNRDAIFSALRNNMTMQQFELLDIEKILIGIRNEFPNIKFNASRYAFVIGYSHDYFEGGLNFRRTGLICHHCIDDDMKDYTFAPGENPEDILSKILMIMRGGYLEK